MNMQRVTHDDLADLSAAIERVRQGLPKVSEPQTKAPPAKAASIDVDVTVQFALELKAARRTRYKYLDSKYLGEPAWDVLLDLYVAKATNRSISVSSACIASGAPATTGLRWLKLLEEGGMIERKAARLDRRSTNVSLTEHANSVIRNYLLATYPSETTETARGDSSRIAKA